MYAVGHAQSENEGVALPGVAYVGDGHCAIEGCPQREVGPRERGRRLSLAGSLGRCSLCGGRAGRLLPHSRVAELRACGGIGDGDIPAPRQEGVV